MLEQLKKIIATEWLVFLGSIVIGVIVVPLIFFRSEPMPKTIDTSQDFDPDAFVRDFDPSTAVPITDPVILKQLNDATSKEHTLTRNLELFKKRRPEFADFDNKAIARWVAKKYPQYYDSFQPLLSDASVGNSDFLPDLPPDPIMVEALSPQPVSILTGFSVFFDHLFSAKYWLETWWSLLIPYPVVQFARSIRWALRTALNAKRR